MTYNVSTTKIFFTNEEGGIAICSPTGDIPVEVVAARDLPAGTPYWIVDFKTEEAYREVFADYHFFDAYELDQDELGEPHGIAIGREEWDRLHPTNLTGE